MILGIDIGGTAVKLGLVDRAGVIHARHEASVSFDGYKTPVLTTVLREAEAFVAREAALLADSPLEGAGISATGQIDERTGAVCGTNGKIPGWEGSQLAAETAKRFVIPAYALNDANAAVLGECFAGRAKGYCDVVMITLGTGVGGGIVSGGRLVSGARGIAGELGHFTLDRRGPLCTCGKRGCYEYYASSTGLVRMAEAETGKSGLNGRIIFSRAEAGDEAMLRTLDAWIDAVADGLTGLIHIFNPQLVLVGGGVSSQEELLIAPLRERVLSGVMPRFAEGLLIERAHLSNDAGIIGAAKYFIDRNSGNA